MIESKKYDMLNKYYQYRGKWKKAIEIAEKYDRKLFRKTLTKIIEFIIHYYVHFFLKSFFYF